MAKNLDEMMKAELVKLLSNRLKKEDIVVLLSALRDGFEVRSLADATFGAQPRGVTYFVDQPGTTFSGVGTSTINFGTSNG